MACLDIDIMASASHAAGAQVLELVVLSPADEADLRRYFNWHSPAPPGTASHFGPMCKRLMNAVNRATTELPTPLVVDMGEVAGAPWTEVVACGGSPSCVADPETAMVEFLDAGVALRRVRRALAAVPDEERRALEAYYSADEPPPEGFAEVLAIGSLTEAARNENRRRAASDRHEPVKLTVRDLKAVATDRRASKADREVARATLRSVEREARALLRRAQVNYHRARHGERS